MSVKENANRKPFPRGGIGSYGNYPWDASYDHDSFLSEMVPVSFQRDEDNKPGGLTEEMLIRGITPFPLVTIGLHEDDYLMPAKAGFRK